MSDHGHEGGYNGIGNFDPGAAAHHIAGETGQAPETVTVQQAIDAINNAASQGGDDGDAGNSSSGSAENSDYDDWQPGDQ